MLAGFLAAGMIVMGVHLGATSNAFFVWLPAILSVLPGALAGILAAALIGNGVQESQAETPNTALTEVPGGGGWFCGVLALAIFGFFSPLFLPYGITRPAPRVDPPEKPVIAEQTPAPALPPPEPIKLVPPPPPFEFKPDSELVKMKNSYCFSAQEPFRWHARMGRSSTSLCWNRFRLLIWRWTGPLPTRRYSGGGRQANLCAEIA